MNNNKERYEAPEVETVAIKAEGMVCASGDPIPGNFPDLGEPITW